MIVSLIPITSRLNKRRYYKENFDADHALLGLKGLREIQCKEGWECFWEGWKLAYEKNTAY